MNDHTVLLFTRNGLGKAPTDLPQKLAAKFLQLNLDANTRTPRFSSTRMYETRVRRLARPQRIE